VLTYALVCCGFSSSRAPTLNAIWNFETTFLLKCNAGFF
jgi:hypothetical protein